MDSSLKTDAVHPAEGVRPVRHMGGSEKLPFIISVQHPRTRYPSGSGRSLCTSDRP